MIRRLADRLVALDLLTEAADLLQHQVDNRLTGASKAVVAGRLALIHLMNRQPARAYQTLKESRAADLPTEVKRSRALLEARALSDLSRTDLAVELVEAESGPDVERLRADILWQGRRWREAAEVFERIIGDRWQGPEPLDERTRADVMRAAIAYGLAEEDLALERMRAKFSGKMADSQDARSFALVTSHKAGLGSADYREVARSVASADTLADFLAEYRQRYPDMPRAPLRSGPSTPPQPEPAPVAPGETAKPGASLEAPPGASNPRG
jgi:hypothetical protein